LASDPMKTHSHLRNGYKHENKKKADLIIEVVKDAFNVKMVTYDFARLMDSPTEVKCSEFGDALIKHRA
jgi:isocitrate dehydrogenase